MYVKLRLSVTSKLGVSEEQAYAELSGTERTFFQVPLPVMPTRFRTGLKPSSLPVCSF